ncbi:hypothetical protein CHS0354_039961 [Potamilus streckersoni]|uniref:von Willebrand factor A domain-containing protein 5A n=1 Tax=Potamilus streckersoni TaxID=2493646 RepID=A0AAE0T2T0_9BIVA|nr:hypothetical protein CHS0354_039961 [Potamilus streckersoni]
MADKRQGLITSAGKTVPLKEINVSVSINGFVADIQSTSHYVNDEVSPIEAIFVFPVDDQSAMYKFEVDIDGRHLLAECHEKGQAREIYDDAVSKGITSLLLEEDESSGDIYRCKLGNLQPKGEAKVSMGFVTELDIEPDGKVKFTLPTILNPRYSPSKDIGSLKLVEVAGCVAPNNIPYRVSFRLTIRGSQRIKGVQGKYIKVDVEYDEDRKEAKVSLDDEFKFDHDLCVLMEYDDSSVPQIILEKGNPDSEELLRQDVLMVNFVLTTPIDIPKTSPGEFIFIIDRSGSMEGKKIQNAKEALLLFLKSIPIDSYFNVIGFGSGFESLFPYGSDKYNDENLTLALNLQRRISADLGGTEILSPLQYVYKQKLIDNFPRQLFLLTDGEVSNVSEVVKLAKANAQHTRVFTVGIGHGASTALVRGLAAAGKGKEVFVTDTERLQPKVISLLKCAMQPAATEVEMLWELPPSVTKIMIPQELPYVYFGERQIVFLLLSGTDKVDPTHTCSLTLKGKIISTQFEHKETFTFHVGKEHGTSFPIHRLAARAQIRQLQLNDAPKEQIMLVSKAANVISKHTAFVMVDTKEQAMSCCSKTVTIPHVTLYSNQYDILDSRSVRCSRSIQSALMNDSCATKSYAQYACADDLQMKKFCVPKSKASGNFLGKLYDGIRRHFRKDRQDKSQTMLQAGVDDAAYDYKVEESSPSQANYNDSILMEIIKLQKFQGLWDLSRELIDLLGAQADILKSHIPTQIFMHMD